MDSDSWSAPERADYRTDVLASRLIALSVFAAVGGPNGEAFTPVVFGTLPDGTPGVCVSMQVAPRTG